MLRWLKYLMLGKEKIELRKAGYSDPHTVQLIYKTNWGRIVIGTIKNIGGTIHYGLDVNDGSRILGEIVHDMGKEILISCIMDAETYILGQIKKLQIIQIKLFKVNVYYRGAFSEDAQKLLREILKLNEDIKLMAAQINEYKDLIEANDTNQT